MKRKNAVLLLSGGLDSAANLVLCPLKLAIDVRICLTIDYGQKSAEQEILHARKLSEKYGGEHVVFELKDFSQLIGSPGALLNQDLESPAPVDLDKVSEITQSAKAVWVPNRNAMMLSIAAALAESRGFEAVAVGFNAEEAVTFPDNSLEFMNAMTGAFRFSTSNQIEVVSATVGFNKKEIVRKLTEESADFSFEFLWSCYRGGRVHCGECESCKRLKRAMTA